MSEDVAALLVLVRSVDKSATLILGAKTEIVTNTAESSQQLLAALDDVRRKMAAFTLACEAKLIDTSTKAAQTIRVASEDVTAAVTRHDAVAVTALGRFNDGRAKLAKDILATIDPALATIKQELSDQVRRLDQTATTTGRHLASVDRSVKLTAALGIAAICLAALLAAGITWAALGWQRREIADLAAQKVALLAEIDTATAQVTKLKLRGADLEWTNCTEDRGMLHQDRIRRCIRVDRDLGNQNPPMIWGDATDHYVVPQGY